MLGNHAPHEHHNEIATNEASLAQPKELHSLLPRLRLVTTQPRCGTSRRQNTADGHSWCTNSASVCTRKVPAVRYSNTHSVLLLESVCEESHTTESLNGRSAVLGSYTHLHGTCTVRVPTLGIMSAGRQGPTVKNTSMSAVLINSTSWDIRTNTTSESLPAWSQCRGQPARHSSQAVGPMEPAAINHPASAEQQASTPAGCGALWQPRTRQPGSILLL